MPHWKLRLDAMTKIPASKPKGFDSQQVLQALLRASEKARLLAEQTGTPFIVRQPAKPSVAVSKRK
jgi:hypothetical protein